jgi:hypothetical protein
MFGVACVPDQGVKKGPPELIEFTIMQAGGMATTVKSDTPECLSGVVTGSACLPMGHAADVADGGTFDAMVPPDALCRQTSAMNWCTCVTTDPDTDPTAGTWSCDPLTNVAGVIAVFDRLLDTAPLDPGDAAGVTGLMTVDAAGAPDIMISSDYSSSGNAKGLVFPLFGAAYFGNFRANGPSLFGAPDPEFPSGATIMLSLNGEKVRAKDGKTAFIGNGLLLGGTLVFTTAPFSASLSKPDATAMDPNAVTLAFTNFAPDPTAHLTAKANGTVIMITAASSDGGSTWSITPMAGGAWPAGATIEISLDATTPNLLGQTIAAAPMPLTFPAP